MTLDRAIAFFILIVCLLYGYSAWFIMDAEIPPFMARNPVWPSSFPKILAIGGMFFSFLVLITPYRPKDDPDLDLSRLSEYNYGQAIGLLALMTAYALLLLPLGFLASTFLFLMIGSLILGERRWVPMILASGIASVGIWYLVQEVLGIFLRPLPAMFGA
ncbi:tripartite tricarboxylate transporter TctB family protein [Sedimentitalea todarodis]|uniref:Tripartite tricarboxylate transporter TctB family protein n=1 Tax=Sedimentitalea todarodis TaxID=1631240 RepID=A0ABU3VJJ7_9RHOB|nr:tripartite tricarboxylate transporter TctB family protein [Sedimentitalea todarodis]MDU9006366.1 tripartite tricarboxylate transporter TctB family protein [Sedimentitalea todarodis]